MADQSNDPNLEFHPKMQKSGDMPFSVDQVVVQDVVLQSGVNPTDESSALDWESSENERASLSWRWKLFFIFCAIVTLLAGAVWVKSMKSNIVVEQIAPEKSIDDGAPVFSRPPREVVDAFVTTADPQERLKWVRNPQDVAKRMLSYPAQALTEPVDKIVELGLVNNGSHVVAGFGAIFANGQKRLISVLPTPDGPRVDWDCYARYCSATWSQLLSNEVKSAEVRVYASPSDYYNFGYDEKSWDCYLLSGPDLEGIVYAYVVKGKRTAQILSNTLSWGAQPVKMTFRISGTPKGVLHRQFLIDRVLAYSWVRGERDMQDTWVMPHDDEDLPVDSTSN